MVFDLRRSDGPSHCQGAEEQHASVDSTKLGVQKLTAALENFGSQVAKNGIGTKHTAKKQYFRSEKKPHAELSRVKLLLRRVEMVSEERRVRVIMITMVMVVVCVRECGFSGGHCVGLARAFCECGNCVDACKSASKPSYTEKPPEHTTIKVRQIAALG